MAQILNISIEGRFTIRTASSMECEGMDQDIFEFLRSLKERNRADHIALQCARFVLGRAKELSPEGRKYMIEYLKELISERKAEMVEVLH